MGNKTKIDVLSSVFLFGLALIIFFDLSWAVFGLAVSLWLVSMVILIRSIRASEDSDLLE